MNTRESLVPQWRDYDRLVQRWLPFLMFFHPTNFTSPSVNTDAQGFRVTHGSTNEPLPTFHSSKDLGIVVGGSTAFGVGASHDRYTIPSYLNQLDPTLQWINFGGRAFTSSQELLLFLHFFEKLPHLKKIILFSGVNDLVIFHLAPRFELPYGSFFFASHYYKAMATIFGMSRKRSLFMKCLRPLLGERFDYSSASLRDVVSHLLGRSAHIAPTQPQTTQSKDRRDVIALLKSNLIRWKALLNAQGVQLTYVLQPYAPWIARSYSPEEAKIFSPDNEQPEMAAINKHMRREDYEWYTGEIEKSCKDLSIPFLDMNRELTSRHLDGQWIFVDRVHLTDLGYSIVSNILKENCS